MDWSGIGASLVGSIAGGLFSRSSAAEQFGRQKELMDLQHQYNVDDYKHRYQWSVQDMRAAGLNPILAATQGIGGSINGVSAGAASMAQTPDFASSLANSAKASTDKALAVAGLKLHEREIAVAEKNAETARQGMENENASKQRELDMREAKQNFDMKWDAIVKKFNMEQTEREVDGKLELMKKQGESLEKQADAALQNSATQRFLAQIAYENGVSHRALEAAEAAFCGKQGEFLEKQGDSEEARKELLEAETALARWRYDNRGIDTMKDICTSIVSIAVGAKVGLDVYNSVVPTPRNPIGFNPSRKVGF